MAMRCAKNGNQSDFSLLHMILSCQGLLHFENHHSRLPCLSFPQQKREVCKELYHHAAFPIICLRIKNTFTNKYISHRNKVKMKGLSLSIKKCPYLYRFL